MNHANYGGRLCHFQSRRTFVFKSSHTAGNADYAYRDTLPFPPKVYSSPRRPPPHLPSGDPASETGALQAREAPQSPSTGSWASPLSSTQQAQTGLTAGDLSRRNAVGPCDCDLPQTSSDLLD